MGPSFRGCQADAADVSASDLVQSLRSDHRGRDLRQLRDAQFTGIDFMIESVPDETTLCKFRYLLEENGLNKLFFGVVNRVMETTGHMMKGSTIVDVTIINVPSSTKNAEKARDPEMHQTKKRKEWCFSMKCHIGVDAGSGLVHTIEVTAANQHDVTVASKLIREV